MATLITIGIEYAQLLEDLRLAIRHEVDNLLNPIKQPTSELGGVKLAQEITRLSKSRIYALVHNRVIPHSKRGNKLYFNRTDLMAWVEAGNRTGKEVTHV
ncbi:helix-turn-helix domain-containing protein [Hymenobacter sp. BT730]|uniref:helix-turn-helix domain-containing protein n=1 Tax=Hymenobacter sp. BT730 TaxID=3063332 RepID=UPI0026E05F94|nr:helix-turn-helix domain-containing protein [Hymenobacter sp. BT730]